MHAHHEVTRLAGELGFRLRLDTAAPLHTLTAALDALCARAEDSGGQQVVVVDLGPAAAERSWPAGAVVQDVNRWERAVRRLERLAAVSMAVAARTTGGPALDVLLATDYRITAPDATLLLPVTDGQFWPGMAVHRLAHHVGVAVARQLVLWGHEIPPRRALDLGLVDEVADDVDAAVRAAAVWLGREPAAEVAVRRRLLLEAPAVAYEEALGAHLAACDRELRRTAGPPRPPAAESPAAPAGGGPR